MRNVRGFIALAIAVTLGFVAVKAVSYYLNKTKTARSVRPVKKVVQKEKPIGGPFSAIPKGMRVITIKVDSVSGVSSKLRKGDLVDIIATTSLSGMDDGRVSRIIFKKVRIYDVSGIKGEKAGGVRAQRKSWNVSLLLSPENAAMLTAALKGADITLMACNTKDNSGTGKNNARYVFTRNWGIQKLSDTDIDVCRNIPVGMRAVTIPVKETDGICGVIRPGDTVDVLLSSKLARIAGKDFRKGERVTVTSSAQLSKMILQNMEVIATENTVKSGCNTNMPVKLVTLLASPQDAVTLAAAVDTSKKMAVRLICRGQDDTEPAETKSVEVNNLFRGKYYHPYKIVVYKGTKIQVMRF